MIKKIGRLVYDTEQATVVKKKTFGVYGDPKGYEETLFVNEKGNMFLYTNGGPDSPYTKENICAMSKTKAETWMQEQ